MQLPPNCPSLRESIRRHRTFYAATFIIAVALRLFFIWKLSLVPPDSLVYGDIAKNWLHGAYGLSGGHPPGPAGSMAAGWGVEPTYIRLPGYPALLALCFTLFGMENYRAAMVLNLVLDLATCFLIASIALRTAGERAARIAFALAATCIFLANYVATPLTETPAIFTVAAAFAFAVGALSRPDPRGQSRRWLLSGLFVAFGILLRPDGGILLAALLLYLAIHALRAWPADRRRFRASVLPHFRTYVGAALILIVVALAPLIPWTIRNYRVFHVFQPLAPVYANSPDEFVPRGFIRWQRSWIADYASVEDIWFHIPGEEISLADLPSRAFDSPAERAQTEQLIAAYNRQKFITPALDDQFAALAAARIHRHPLRYYLMLPALRALDLWLRPHTEMLPLDPHWWRYSDDLHDSLIGSALGLLGLFYVAAALACLVPASTANRQRPTPALDDQRPATDDARPTANRQGPVALAGLFLCFFLLRTAFLSSMPNPEQRYLLECFPALLVFSAARLALFRPQTTDGRRPATRASN